MALSPETTRSFVNSVWDDSITPTLTEYIRIPNKSPAFDPDWQANGHMDRAVDLIEAWCKEHAPSDATVEVIRLENRTPVLLIDVPGKVDDCILLYGHLDKQPEMTGWDDDLDPWKPVLKGDKLYGRGGADDGYAAFGSLTAVNALRKQGVDHARCVILIEACEESGSYDLPHYIDHLAPRLGTPSLVVCLDAGCGNYDQLWTTTSLRGMLNLTLTVELISEGVHCGDASGVVADSFRVARHLLSRIEDPETGDILPKELHAKIPEERVDQARQVAEATGDAMYEKFPFLKGVQPITKDGTQLILNRAWRPTLTVTGADGLPPLKDAGNVTRPKTSLKLSFRLPPTADDKNALEHVKNLLTSDPPYGAKVTLSDTESAAGWNAPATAEWLLESIRGASKTHFDADPMFMGEGGSIPFMGMLGEKFPEAQFFITGVLGPGSNAHGPNEFLHIPTGKRLTAAVSQVIADHAQRTR